MQFLKLFPILFLINIAFAQQTIKDLTVNDFKVENVKQGSKPCPLMTETQRNAIPSPQNGRCIYNTTAGKLNIYNSTAGIWKAAGGGVDAWVTAFSYSVDDLVIQSSKIYQALIAHTSSVFATDLAANRWIEISAMPNLTGDITSVGSVTSYNAVVPILKGGTGNTTGNATTVTTNANMTGAVTSVGNATSLGSFTSANLATALTNETGTGVSVFSTSPTLVTPEIGAATGTSLALGGTINANAVADFQSTTKAFIAPRMTTAQKNAIPSPVAGMEVFDTTIGAKSFYNGTQWISNLVITSDTVYSAQLANTTGAISNQTGTWLSSCSRSGTNTGIITCVPTANRFTVTPNCGGSVNIVSSDQSTVMYNYGSSTATSLVFHTATPTTPAASAATLTNAPLGIWCQKSGADYTNSSSSAILSSNADTSWAPCTFSTLAWQGLGTVNNALKCKRLGDSLKMRGYLAAGTPTASIIQVPLPNNFGTLTVGSTVDTATSFGSFFRNVTGADVFYNTVATAGASYFGMSSALINAGSNPAVASGGTSVAGSGNVLTIDGELTIPIAGWTQSPIAIIPLAETVKVPGASQVDHIRFRFGGTTLINECTTGSCYKESLSPTSPTTISFVSTGLYNILFPRTYTRLICFGSGYNPTVNVIASGFLSCNNCNSSNILFATGATPPVSTNNYGMIDCQGTY